MSAPVGGISFIKQFVEKDLANVSSLKNMRWVFDGKYKGVLKEDILKVLKSPKGKAALNELYGNGQLQKLLPNEKIKSVDDFLDKISEDNYYKTLIDVY